MPTGYKFSTRQGRWNKINNTQAFDYDNVDTETSAFLISYFRAFPDRFLDLVESPNADFTLAFPQRVILRSMSHFGTTFTDSSRGIGKTYIELLWGMVQGVLYPGERMRQYAPSLKQSAELATTAFHQIERNYPPLAALWKIKSESKDTFKIITDYGSEYAIGAIQGGNCNSLICEECGQETDPKFDFHDFESKVIPTCRLGRSVNKIADTTYNRHYIYITNASRRQNPTYYKYRANTMRDMAIQPKWTAWAIDISWEMSLLFGIRDKAYIEQQKNTMTREDFLRQMCATFTGASENPMISDEDLSASRNLLCMENKHCGDPNVIYIVGHDVSYEEGSRNAKCSDVVMKLTQMQTRNKLYSRDKFKKDIVWVDSYTPFKDPMQSALHLKDLWRRFSLDSGQKTWLAIDSWQFGNAIMRNLIKPMGDGINLCCYKHLEAHELEGDFPLDVIYPVKAGGAGVRDNDAEMVRYMRMEFQQGNISLLTTDSNEGLEQYKRLHRIKDDFADGKILQPYYKTNELCEQIQNLQVVVSGTGDKEKRISQYIQRDDWSALKYCGRVAKILEEELEKSHAKKQSSWANVIANNTNALSVNGARGSNARINLLGLRRK